MMVGVVNAVLEATLPLQVFGPAGQQQATTAVIDTAYDGELSLPIATVTALALGPPTPGSVTLGDGSRRTVNYYRAEVTWDGQRLPVRILCVEGAPLLGTGLLKGNKLDVEFVDGGPVSLRPLF